MEIKILTEAESEPVTLSEIKSWCEIDQDYAADDEILNLIAKSARKRLEKQLNISFAVQQILCQWNGDLIDIPYGPVVEIEGVTSSSDLANQVPYYSQGLDYPSIHIAGQDCYIIYPVGWLSSKLYNLTYTAGYDELPVELKQSLLIQIDFDLKGRGIPEVDLSPDALRKANPFSRNLSIQS